MVLFSGLWTTRRTSRPSSSRGLPRRTRRDEGEPEASNSTRRDYQRSVLFGGLWSRRSITSRDEDDREKVAKNGITTDDVDHAGSSLLLSYHAHESKHDENAEEEPFHSSYGTIYDSDDDDENNHESLTGEYSPDIDFDVLKLCGLYTLSYVGIAIIAFSFVFEHWTIIDSIYFAVSTFTTVGYGDLQPKTEAGQIFTIFFAVYGVIILGIFIGIVGHAISEGREKATRQLKRGRQEKLLKTLFQSSRRVSRSPTPSEVRSGFFGDHVTLLDDVKEVCRAEFPEILVVMILAYILGVREGWSFTSTMYFAIMSASTTGYGDYCPQTQVDKVYCIFFLPLSVAVFGEILGRIASIYIQRRVRRNEQEFLRRTVTLCDLRKMDTNRDGQVSMEEFLTFMLVTLQRCEQETIDELKAIFHALDTNGNGVLEKDDLIELNRQAKLTEMASVSSHMNLDDGGDDDDIHRPPG